MTKLDIIKQQAAIIEALEKEKKEAINRADEAELKANEAELRAKQAEATVEDQKLQIEYLSYEVAMLQNKKYGIPSDDITKSNYPNLFNYETFNEAEFNADSKIEEPKTVEEIVVKEHVRKKKKKNLINDTNNLKTIDIYHDLTDEEKICSLCGKEMVKIGETISEKIVFIPSELIIERHHYSTYKCNDCSEECEKAVIVKPQYELAFPKSMASSSLVSHIITEKFAKYVPLYRQEKFFNDNGIALTRITMSNWIMKACEYLKPLFKLMHEDALKYEILLLDETTIKVIKNDNSTCYIWMINTSKYDIPIYLYFFKESREHHHAQDILKGFKGKYIQSDAYQAYDKIDGVIDCCCLAHAKRKFADILKVTKGKYNLTDTVGTEALNFFRKLYKIEHKLSNKHASIEEIYNTRQAESLPILKEYKAWLEEKYPIFPEKSKMGEALYYNLNNIDKLSNYCLDGRLEIDNNKSERQAKSYVMMRKNSLFCFADCGAEASAVILSVVETAKANNLNVHKYLEYLFDEIAKTDNNVDNLRKLLPYSSDLPENLKIKR